MVYLKKDDTDSALKTLKIIASHTDYFNYNKLNVLKKRNQGNYNGR